MKRRAMVISVAFVTLLMAAMVAIFLTGCLDSGPSAAPETSTTAAPATTIAPSPPSVPEVLSVETVLDPSLAPADQADPYAVMDPYAKEAYNPDRDLYNALYRAIDAMEPSVDISAFTLDRGQIAAVFDSLYAARWWDFYYLQKLELSSDAKSVRITYTTDDTAQVRRDKETFTARLAHLVYNVAPEPYTDLQKVLAVYQYLCEVSDYSSDEDDLNTTTPWGILMKRQGICNGFAQLTAYTLTRAGVPVEYACNDAHAWNIVTVGGRQYHMDVTFGAGFIGGTAMNSLAYVFMDDGVRSATLQEIGAGQGPMIVGWYGDDPTPAPPCTATDMAFYNTISLGWVDVDQGKVYYVAQGGDIRRMNLDGTGVETLATTTAVYALAVYDGTVYYLGGREKGQVYRLNGDGTSEPLDDTMYLIFMEITGGKVRFGDSLDGIGAKTIRLTDFDPGAWDGAETVALPVLSVPRSRSFATTLTFSEPMDTAADWSHLVYLATPEGDPVPLHFLWSADGKTLSLRPQECVADMSSVTVYVSEGAPAAGGGVLPNGCIARVDVRSGE
jgi:hypothetical protein